MYVHKTFPCTAYLLLFQESHNKQRLFDSTTLTSCLIQLRRLYCETRAASLNAFLKTTYCFKGLIEINFMLEGTAQ
jgi:hypothetical protein